MVPILTLALLGCEAPGETRVTGRIFAGHGDDAPPLSGAEVSFVVGDASVLDRVETDADGAFTVRLPHGTNLFVEVRADGYATTTFPAVIGLDRALEVEDHLLYGFPAEERDAILTAHAGCDGAEPGAALVVGEMRLYGWADPDTGESPTVTTGVATVLGRGSTEWAGCYLDEAGLAYDPEAFMTGDSGRFTVFGPAPGLHDLDARYEVSTDVWSAQLYPVWIPEDEGAVSPWYPAWVEFPL